MTPEDQGIWLVVDARMSIRYGVSCLCAKIAKIDDSHDYLLMLHAQKCRYISTYRITQDEYVWVRGDTNKNDL